MRLFVVAAMIVSLAIPAFAQGHRKNADQQKTTTPAVKANAPTAAETLRALGMPLPPTFNERLRDDTSTQ